MPQLDVIAYWSSESGRFVAEVSQMPGWVAEGKTYHEAITNVQSMIDDWVDEARFSGQPVPVVSGKFIVV